jgi:predicted nucleotidyltransferase
VEKRLEFSLREATNFLDRCGYRYAIVGGIALAHWGVVRATYDIDIKVLVPDSDYAAVRKSLWAEFSNTARPHLPENSLVVSVSINDVIVDFLLALPGYEELIVERANQRELDGWSVWICSAEDLVIQKVVAGRNKDWLDVETLLIEQRDRLDQVYIQDWLAQFVEALEKPEIITTYERLLIKAKNV